MNEQSNIALIQALYATVEEGDTQATLNYLTEDILWVMEGPAIIPYTGKRNGIAQVKQFFSALAATQTDTRLTTEEFVAQGDQIAMVGRYVASVKATGKKFDAPVAHFFSLRNGKVSRFVLLGDTAAMAEAYRAAR